MADMTKPLGAFLVWEAPRHSRALLPAAPEAARFCPGDPLFEDTDGWKPATADDLSRAAAVAAEAGNGKINAIVRTATFADLRWPEGATEELKRAAWLALAQTGIVKLDAAPLPGKPCGGTNPDSPTTDAALQATLEALSGRLSALEASGTGGAGGNGVSPADLPPDPHFDKVALLLQPEPFGEIRDLSRFQSRLLENGGKHSVFGEVPVNAAGNMLFDGTSALRFAGHPGMNAGSGDFTIEFDLFPKDLVYSHTILASGNETDRAGDYLLLLDGHDQGAANSPSRMRFSVFNLLYAAQTPFLPLHRTLQCCVQRSGGVYSIYVAGKRLAVSGARNDAINFAFDDGWNPGVGSILVGMNGWNRTAHLKGTLRRLRLTVGVARYSGDSYDPPAAFPLAGPETEAES